MAVTLASPAQAGADRATTSLGDLTLKVVDGQWAHSHGCQDLRIDFDLLFAPARTRWSADLRIDDSLLRITERGSWDSFLAWTGAEVCPTGVDTHRVRLDVSLRNEASGAETRATLATTFTMKKMDTVTTLWVTRKRRLVTITGWVLNAKEGGADPTGGKVIVQRKKRSGWRRVARRTLSSSSGYTVKVKGKKGTRYRVKYKGTLAAQKSISSSQKA